LIGTDVITSEKMVIDLHKRKLVISSCGNMSCAVRITARNRMEKHCIRTAATVTIQPHISAVIPIRFKELKTNQDYVFRLYPNNMYLPDNTYTLSGIVKGDQDSIRITNGDDVPRMISKGTRVGQIGSHERATHRWDDASNEMNEFFTGTSKQYNKTVNANVEQVSDVGAVHDIGTIEKPRREWKDKISSIVVKDQAKEDCTTAKTGPEAVTVDQFDDITED
jgi:hypothetical protein